jgi:predicted ribonuclease YlaK
VDEVRLVLPLRVVEELDERKYAGRGDLADRARRLLSALWALLEPTKGAPAALVAGVTIELPVDDGPRRRTLDADEEVLAECSTLAAVGAPVTLVTGDCGMSLRAAGRGLPVARMPEKYLRVQPKAPEDGAPPI